MPPNYDKNNQPTDPNPVPSASGQFATNIQPENLPPNQRNLGPTYTNRKILIIASLGVLVAGLLVAAVWGVFAAVKKQNPTTQSTNTVGQSSGSATISAPQSGFKTVDTPCYKFIVPESSRVAALMSCTSITAPVNELSQVRVVGFNYGGSLEAEVAGWKSYNKDVHIIYDSAANNSLPLKTSSFQAHTIIYKSSLFALPQSIIFVYTGDKYEQADKYVGGGFLVEITYAAEADQKLLNETILPSWVWK